MQEKKTLITIMIIIPKISIVLIIQLNILDHSAKYNLSKFIH